MRINKTDAHRVTDKDEETEKCLWEDIKVGDLIKVKENDVIPADMVLIQTSEKKGQCFVSTIMLNGEIDLKRKLV